MSRESPHTQVNDLDPRTYTGLTTIFSQKPKDLSLQLELQDGPPPFLAKTQIKSNEARLGPVVFRHVEDVGMIGPCRPSNQIELCSQEHPILLDVIPKVVL
jgi:hypothetical protein